MKYRILITDEAVSDMVSLIRYVQIDLRNPDAAKGLFEGLKKEISNLEIFPLRNTESGVTYRKYIIYKKVYQSYLLFYIINSKERTVSILRVLKDIMDWPGVLRETKIYHFSNYKVNKINKK